MAKRVLLLKIVVGGMHSEYIKYRVKKKKKENSKDFPLNCIQKLLKTNGEITFLYDLIFFI